MKTKKKKKSSICLLHIMKHKFKNTTNETYLKHNQLKQEKKYLYSNKTKATTKY